MKTPAIASLLFLLVAPQRDAAPQRDVGSAATSGAATITGVVLTDENAPLPVRRAIVALSGGDPAVERTAITDDGGRFEFSGLPAGRYNVTARKAAYITAAYGAIRPGRPGTAISLSATQRADIRISLPRGAVISGVLRDSTGVPVPGILVGAINLKADNQDEFAFSSDMVATDDRGVYRLFGLVPGEYVVAAATRTVASGAVEIGGRSTAEMDDLLEQLKTRANRVGAAGPAPAGVPGRPAEASRPLPLAAPVSFPVTYLPGTPRFDQAEHIRLAAGEEHLGADFAFTVIPTASIEGSVTGMGAASIGNVQLAIWSPGPRSLGLGTSLVLAMPPGPDGRFKYTSVAPGHYTLMARGARGSAPAPAGAAGGGGGGGLSMSSGGFTPGPAGEYWFAVAEVDVDGRDIVGLTMPLAPGATLSGRIAFDGGDSPFEDLTKLRVSAAPVFSTGYSNSGGTIIGNAFQGTPPASVRADGAFDIPRIAPGTFVLRASTPQPTDMPAGWWLRSAIVNGRDALDVPLEVNGGVMAGAVLTFTNRHSDLGGQLQGATGQPAPEYFVIAFPTDRALWIKGARRVRVVRPATDGTYVFRDLPAGEYFLAALSDVAPNEWQDRAFLEQLVRASLKVTVAEGQTTTQSIRIAGH